MSAARRLIHRSACEDTLWASTYRSPAHDAARGSRSLRPRRGHRRARRSGREGPRLLPRGGGSLWRGRGRDGPVVRRSLAGPRSAGDMDRGGSRPLAGRRLASRGASAGQPRLEAPGTGGSGRNRPGRRGAAGAVRSRHRGAGRRHEHAHVHGPPHPRGRRPARRVSAAAAGGHVRRERDRAADAGRAALRPLGRAGSSRHVLRGLPRHGPGEPRRLRVHPVAGRRRGFRRGDARGHAGRA